ncbi:MAG TPA: hypothetical protein VK897_25535 [Anaerolineales bacterium]|nr:hypothetical protein [Anaerolineales bacterium]
MSTNRLFKVLIALALVIAVILTVQEAIATSAIKSSGNTAVACYSLPSHYSIRSEYAKDANMWILRTEDGPTGVDGGLIELLSGYRTCSRWEN